MWAQSADGHGHALDFVDEAQAARFLEAAHVIRAITGRTMLHPVELAKRINSMHIQYSD